MLEGARIGIIRLQPDQYFGSDCLEIAVTLAPEFRGLGLGANVMIVALAELPKGVRVVASIKEENTASIRMVLRVGFQFDVETTRPGCVIYRWDSSCRPPAR